MNRKPKRRALWTQFAKPIRSPEKQPRERKPRKRIKPQSKIRAVEMRLYRNRVREYLIANPVCRAHEAGIQCSPVATQIHHSRGRRGRLLFIEKYWRGVCPSGHDCIHRFPQAARELGLLCAVGEWNKP